MTDIRRYFGGGPIGRQPARQPASQPASQPATHRVKCRIRTLAKCEYDENSKKDCAICGEKHKKGENMLTDCRHRFGKQCLSTWFAMPNSKGTCPLCRNVCSFVIEYKQGTHTKKEQYEILVENLWSKMDEPSALAYKHFIRANPSAPDW